MTRIHEGLEYMEFPQPASVESISVCEETGLLPRDGCPVITEYFDIGTEPSEYCDQHFYEVEEEYNYDEETLEPTPTPEGEYPEEVIENGDDDNGEDTGGDDYEGGDGYDDWSEETGEWDEETGQYYYYY